MQDLILLLWDGPPAPPEGGMGGITQFLFLGAAIAVIYFLLIRPQTQQRKKQNTFASTLKKGSKVVTMGGIHGTVADLTETTVDVIIAPKTVITIQREAISMDYTKTVHGEASES